MTNAIYTHLLKALQIPIVINIIVFLILINISLDVYYYSLYSYNIN